MRIYVCESVCVCVCEYVCVCRVCCRRLALERIAERLDLVESRRSEAVPVGFSFPSHRIFSFVSPLKRGQGGVGAVMVLWL